MLTGPPPAAPGSPGTGRSYGGRRAAVLGSPIGHSLSPAMHRAAYAHLGLAEWRYDRHECTEETLVPFLQELGPEWAGLSLTMPLKEVALHVAATADPVARRVGGANTLVRRKDGAWDAYNTDVHGVRAALADHDVADVSRVTMLGSGATARSALVAVQELGARHMTFVVRGDLRPGTAALAEELGLTWERRTLDDVPELCVSSDLVVDTLPGAAADRVAIALAGRAVLPPLFEVIYEGWPTALARTFLTAGAPVVSGLEMLAHQAAAQVRLMTGRDVPARLLLDAAGDALS